jgi:hypothetical protein
MAEEARIVMHRHPLIVPWLTLSGVYQLVLLIGAHL